MIEMVSDEEVARAIVVLERAGAIRKVGTHTNSRESTERMSFGKSWKSKMEVDKELRVPQRHRCARTGEVWVIDNLEMYLADFGVLENERKRTR